MSPFVSRSIRGPAFVGRDRELEILRTCLGRLDEGRGSVSLIFGEPGIGKTRLAHELMEEAVTASKLAVRGTCWEGGGAPAYWPWVEALRVCARQVDRATVADQVATQLAELGALPALNLPASHAAPPEPVADPERSRFRLFEAIADFLRLTSATRGLVLVLDDLHAADRPSLLLLQFLARELRDAPVLLIGCYREPLMRQDAVLDATLAAIARDAIALPLFGLGEREVARFIDSAFGVRGSAAVKAAVRRATGGNPFFMDEVVRLLAADGRSSVDGVVGLPIPGTVRGAIRERLKPLGPGSRALLAVAAIIGHEFDLPLLTAASGQPSFSVLAAVGEARAAAIVVERPESLGRYAFSHGIVRETLYADVPLQERGAAHRRVADALETRYAHDLDAHVAELAYHFAMAAPQDDPAKAIGYCRAAGDRAMRQFAAEEAVTHYTRALQILALTGSDEATRSDLLLALGYALEATGSFETARQTFTEAADLARRRGDVDTFVRAALGPGQLWAKKFIASVFEKSDIAMLEEALALATDDVTRCRILARLGPALALDGSRARGQMYSAEALHRARSLGDWRLLADTLLARHATLLNPSHVGARLTVADEVVRVASEHGDTELALRGRFLRFHDLAESGDAIAADLENARLAALIRRSRDPFEEWNVTVNQAALAFFHGRLATSEELAERAAALAFCTPGQQARTENAGIVVLLQFGMIRREQLRLSDLEHELRQIAVSYPWIVGSRALLALVELERGRPHLARRELDVLASDAFGAVALDIAWLGTMCVTAEICADLHERERAGLLYDRLLPFRRLNATVAGACWLGSAERYLGLAARCSQRLDAAVEHLEIACESQKHMGGPLWSAHTLMDLAETLRERGAARDAERAASVLDTAAAMARTLGSRRLDVRVAALSATTPSPTEPVSRPHVAGSSPAARPSPRVIRQEGEFWTLAYGGTVVRLKQSPGLICLAHLLRHPGREFHASELLSVVYPSPHGNGAPFDETVGKSASVHGESDAGSLIDANARLAYQSRLSQLRAEIDEATTARDEARATVLQAEVDAIAHELGRSIGRGGQPRRAGSPGERARVNVTRMLRTALARIAATHTELASHLRGAVRTGTFCSYRPQIIDPFWDA